MGELTEQDEAIAAQYGLIRKGIMWDRKDAYYPDVWYLDEKYVPRYVVRSSDKDTGIVKEGPEFNTLSGAVLWLVLEGHLSWQD